MLANLTKSMTKKNKVIFTILTILAVVVAIVVIYNTFTVKITKKSSNKNWFEGYADAEEEEEEDEAAEDEAAEDEENTDGGDESAEETFAEDTKANKKDEARREEKPKAPTTPKESSDKTDEKTKDTKSTDKPTSSAVAEVATISQEQVDKYVAKMKDAIKSNKPNADAILKKAMDFYSPQKDKYTDAPMMKSMDKVKMHIQAALQELDQASSTKEGGQTQVLAKPNVSERFMPSREAPKSDVKPIQQDNKTDDTDVIEGFENTPQYAMY